jgi:hypothetical protein
MNDVQGRDKKKMLPLQEVLVRKKLDGSVDLIIKSKLIHTDVYMYATTDHHSSEIMAVLSTLADLPRESIR